MTSATLIAAIMMVESGGDCKAVGTHGEVGPAQIKMDVIVDVNERFGTAYTSEDRRSVVKSAEVMRLYIERYGHAELDDEERARLWNGGPEGRHGLAAAEYSCEVELVVDAASRGTVLNRFWELVEEIENAGKNKERE
jgi:hypothetical protein